MSIDNPSMTLAQCARRAADRLSATYADSEAAWLVRVIFEELKGYTKVDMVVKASDEVSDYLAAKVDGVVDRLLNHEPVQYIFGNARFYGLKFKVTRDTLIPRPETEELVDMIVRDADGRSDMRVLDVCTGSGCIAVALGRNLVFPQISATDISDSALCVARENAAALKVKVAFSHVDALHMSGPSEPIYDVVVSNPPYIMPDERAAMSANVLDYEPHTALFVPENDPLVFYKAIEAFAFYALSDGGRLYFEINPRLASQLSGYLSAHGWVDVDVVRDMQKLNRFITATRPSR